MTTKEYELLHRVANQRFPPWIEDPDGFQTTKDPVEWGDINKVDPRSLTPAPSAHVTASRTKERPCGSGRPGRENAQPRDPALAPPAGGSGD
jgi:hypothetical protein